MARDTVQSVARAMALLDQLARAREGLRLSDLARDTGLATSTTHRILVTLEAGGYVRCDRKGALWHMGAALEAWTVTPG